MSLAYKKYKKGVNTRIVKKSDGKYCLEYKGHFDDDFETLYRTSSLQRAKDAEKLFLKGVNTKTK